MKLLKVSSEYDIATLLEDGITMHCYLGKDEIERAINEMKNEGVDIEFYTEWGEELDSYKNLNLKVEKDFQNYIATLSKEECVKRAYRIAVMKQIVSNLNDIASSDCTIASDNKNNLDELIKEKDNNILMDLFDYYFNSEHPEFYDIWGFQSGISSFKEFIEDFTEEYF